MAVIAAFYAPERSVLTRIDGVNWRVSFLAISHGNQTTYNLNTLLHQNILQSDYFHSL